MHEDAGTSINDDVEKKSSLVHEWTFIIAIGSAVALLLFQPVMQLFTLLLKLLS